MEEEEEDDESMSRCCSSSEVSICALAANGGTKPRDREFGDGEGDDLGGGEEGPLDTVSMINGAT